MQPVNGQDSVNQSLWMSSSWVPTGPCNENGGELSLSKMVSIDTEGTLHSIINDSVHSVDVPLQNPNFQDHEMFSWLHFPIDDVIEKGFYADLIREVPGSTVQIVKHSFNQLGLQQDATTLGHNSSEALLNDVLPPNPCFSSFICPAVSQGAAEAVESCSSFPNELRNMVAGADAVMVARTGNVTSISTSHQSGAEGFSKMQAAALPAEGTWQSAKLKNFTMVPLVNRDPSLLDPLQQQFSSLSQEAPSLPVLKPQDASLCTTQPILHRNFSHFSSPVAETRASLHALSASSGPSSIERARQHYEQAGKDDANVNKQVAPTELVVMDVDSRQAPLPFQVLRPMSLSGQAGELSKTKDVGEDNLVSSHLSNSTITASNMAMEKLYIIEQTVTSPSRGSGSSSDQKSGKEAATVLKRRSSGVDDFECQSEEFEEMGNSSKKSTKRSRAAEMHNLCERKRRDRINEKLMTLRELMPNSSKTAKASILDEAIEYVKLLQSHLQAWSARTGICIPPALIPSMGLQQVQMPAMPHMGIGMGVGMGVGLGMGMGMRMGMGLVDVNSAVAAGRTMVPLPPYTSLPSSLPSHAMGSSQPCLPAMGVVEGQEHMQNAHLLDPYNIYVPHHQAQMQPSPMNITMYRNMELYNAYLQGQQQQQHQWQQLQQQHQWQLMQQQQLQGNYASKPA
ncbi:hypothetical protein L7F22_054812 [Adiantum nelumboides]|nr:hypothetical protein [Adiantum nelumboides]